MPGIAITGASGFVGSMLARRFEDVGWSVIRLSHSTSGPDTVPFRLGDEVQPEVFRTRNVTALIHCAYDFKPLARAEIHRVNVDGSRKLLAGATTGGVERIAVLSTISAFEGCRSAYGQAKLEIEAAAAAAGALVVRSAWCGPMGLPLVGGCSAALPKASRRGSSPSSGEVGIRSTSSTSRISGSC